MTKYSSKGELIFKKCSKLTHSISLNILFQFFKINFSSKQSILLNDNTDANQALGAKQCNGPQRNENHAV